MTYKLLAAAAFSFALGTAAIAQTDSTTHPEPGALPDSTIGTGLPTGWEGPVGDAFFSDSELGTLRSEDEVRTNWQNLTDEQQAQVRAHCDTIDTAAADTMEAPTDETAASALDAEEDVTTGSTTPDADMHTASIEQVCDWIDTI